MGSCVNFILCVLWKPVFVYEFFNLYELNNVVKNKQVAFYYEHNYTAIDIKMNKFVSVSTAENVSQ